MKYAVTVARRQPEEVDHYWVQHLPAFTIEAISENEAKDKVRVIIGVDCYEPSLSVVEI